MPRRLALVAVVVLTATIGSALAGSARSAPTAAPGAYAANVWLAVGYDVKWAEYTRRDPGCNFWQTLDASNEFVATNTGSRGKPLRAQMYVRRPSQLVGTGAPWANFVAVGKARGHVTRERVEDGGYTAGCTSPPPRFTPPPNDCDTVNLAPLHVVLLAEHVAIIGNTLDYTTGSFNTDPDPDNLAPLAGPVISVSVTPNRRPFRNCPFTTFAPEFPARFALKVSAREWAALRALRKGREVTLVDEVEGGRCTRTAPRGACSFELVLSVTIRRTS